MPLEDKSSEINIIPSPFITYVKEKFPEIVRMNEEEKRLYELFENLWKKFKGEFDGIGTKEEYFLCLCSHLSVISDALNNNVKKDILSMLNGQKEMNFDEIINELKNQYDVQKVKQVIEELYEDCFIFKVGEKDEKYKRSDFYDMSIRLYKHIGDDFLNLKLKNRQRI